MKRINKVIFVWFILLFVSLPVKAQIDLTEGMRSYSIDPVTSAMEVVEWKILAEDEEGDGANAASAAGKTLSYYYEEASDKLWFKYNYINR